MSFSSNLALWLGSTPNALQSGRVDCYVGANNDKTGYSLTAGSYSVRASSSQRGTVSMADAVTSNTASPSTVTITRATLTGTGGWTNDGTSALARNDMPKLVFTNGTTVTANRIIAAASAVTVMSWEVFELF